LVPVLTNWRILTAMSTVGDQVQELTSTIATALLPELASLAEGTAASIVDEMPELADSSNLQLIRASAYSNSNALLDAMIRAMPLDQMAPSAEVVQSTRAMAQHGISHDAVMRGYRLAIAYWCARWADAVGRHCADSALAAPVVGSGTAFLLRWLDMASAQVSAEYRDEAERLARDGSMARAAYVRRLLADEADVSQASRQLGYTLAGYHVALVLCRHPDADQAPLEATALALAQDVANSRPLIVRADPDTVWCWIQTDRVRKQPSTSAAVLVGLGRPASGIAGFRSSHHEALEALRVARIASHAAGTTTTFDEVELVALCTADPAACHTFITETLGSLAADTEEAHRMRVTLETFFACDGNYRATGDRLFIHHNTVRYRLDRIESMLGYRPPKNRRRLDLALHLALQLNLAGTSKESGEEGT
jgi:L-fucose mutarotase/ribose pyranase (RbsD/FucU family)